MKEKQQAEDMGTDGLEPWVCSRQLPATKGNTMREIAYFCPQCQGNEMELGAVQDADGSVAAQCKLCKWSGRSTEIVGAVSPANAQFWNAEKLGNVMMIALARHGAGPLLQALELLGILPRIPVSDEGTLTPERLAEAESAQECRNRVMQAVVGAAVTAAYETAAEVVTAHYAKFDQEQGAAVERVFQFNESGDASVH